MLRKLNQYLGEDKGEEIESSTKGEDTVPDYYLEKGKNEGFITYAELNENLPEGIIEADRLR